MSGRNLVHGQTQIQNHHSYLFIGNKPKSGRTLVGYTCIVYKDKNPSNLEDSTSGLSLVGCVANGEVSPLATAMKDLEKSLIIHMGGRTSNNAERYIAAVFEAVTTSTDYCCSYIRNGQSMLSLASFFISTLPEDIFYQFLDWLSKSKYNKYATGELIPVNRSDVNMGIIILSDHETHLLRSAFSLTKIENGVYLTDIGSSRRFYTDYEKDFTYFDRPYVLDYQK